MIPKTIAIIGGTGQMGSLFAKAFQEAEIEVIISSRKTEITNIEATKKADIIIVTVPIRHTKKTIEEITPYLKEGAMITDFTSVKIKPCKAMQNTTNDDNYHKYEIIGGHPLFGPSAGFEGQNFILCPVKKGEYYVWYKEFLKDLGLNVVEMTAEEHDKNMAIIQCLTHFSNLSLGLALKQIECDLKLTQRLSSPIYLMRLYGVGRILAQDEKLYSDIQMENPYAKEMADLYLKSVKELNNTIILKDKEGFEKIFTSCRKYFGKVCDKSMQITTKLIKAMNNKE